MDFKNELSSDGLLSRLGYQTKPTTARKAVNGTKPTATGNAANGEVPRPERIARAQRAIQTMYDAGLSKDEIAHHVGQNPDTIWSWHRGRYAPSAKKLAKLEALVPKSEDASKQARVNEAAMVVSRLRSKGHSWEEIAAHVGVTPRSVRNWHNRRCAPSEEALSRLGSLE